MLPCECVLPYGSLVVLWLFQTTVHRIARTKISCQQKKITTLEQRTADVARGLYFIETQGAYEIRLGHMSTWPCKSARRFANLQTALHTNKGLLHICRGLCTHTAARCTCAKRRADLQNRLLLCSAARSCAAARAYVHGRL